MSQAAFAQPNSPYVDFWNAVLVPKFGQWRHILVGGLGQHSAKVFPQLKLGSSDAVLDVGCGWGETAIEIARRVGPTGRVVGIDCCDAFLDAGRADAAQTGVGNVRFIAADVETVPLAPEFDVCFSRFGTQFFQNPVAGLRNMRRGLKPGGIMTMIVWRARADNPWLERARKVLLRHLPPVEEDAASCGPGPFSMADPELVTKQLEIAGYRDFAFKRVDAEVMGPRRRGGGRLPPRHRAGRGSLSRRRRGGGAQPADPGRRAQRRAQGLRPPGRRDDGVELVAGDGAQSILTGAEPACYSARRTVASARHSLGERPVAFLKARLKAASES